MQKKLKVYLAGQPNEYENNWKEEFKKLNCFDCYDWEFDSDQSSADTFFPEDMKAVHSADYLVANPGIAPSEGTWMEIGYFYGDNVKIPGDFCDKLIIIWREGRNPKWSLDFVKRSGWVVGSVKEAKDKLREISVRD